MAATRRVGVEEAPSGSRAERRGHVDCPVGDEAPKGRGLAGPGRSLVSTALTLTPYRRCTPERNRSIPTIPAGCTDVWPANVSAVDTGLVGVSSGFLRHGPAPGHRSAPTVPCPPPAQGLVVRVRLRPLPELARFGSSRPAPRGSGSTGQGLCLLHEGPTYPQYSQLSSSSTPSSCSASRRRRQPPQ